MPTLQLRRGLLAALPILADGEPGWTTDTHQLFVGQSGANHEVTGGGSSYTDEEAQDAVGTILVDSSTIDFTYDDATPSITAAVVDASITYAKIQNVSAASKLLGRGDSGTGSAQEITLGSGLTMTGTTLSSSGGVADHGALTGLGDDDHTQYALLAGRAGSQTLVGGTGAGETLTLRGSAHASLGSIMTASPFTMALQCNFDAAVVLAGSVQPNLTGSVNNWNPGGSWPAENLIDVDANGDYNVTGLVAGSSGQVAILINSDTTNTVTLVHGSASSSAGNRFTLPGASNLTVGPGSALMLVYSLDSDWRPIGGGTVSSVALSATSQFSVSGSPVTGSGTLSLSFANQAGNVILASPSGGGSGAPTFRTMVSADIASGIVTFSKIEDLAACSVLGRSANSTGTGGNIALGADGKILARVGTTVNGYYVSDFTSSDGALDDIALIGDASDSGASRTLLLSYLFGLARPDPGGRLTLTTGVPVTTSNVSAAGTVYYTPYLHDGIVLWDGTRWIHHRFSEVSLALSSLTSGKPYDVFGYSSSGALALEGLGWTDATTRATAITYQDGRLCKSGDKTRLYLGTFGATGTGTTEDSDSRRLLINMYNRVPRSLKCSDTTDSWNYTTAAFREANGSSTVGTSRVEVMFALDEIAVDASNHQAVGASVNSTKMIGIGIDSSTTNSAVNGLTQNTAIDLLVARYVGFPGLGYRTLRRLEYSQASGTTTWYGDASTTGCLSGMVGQIRG